MEQQALQTKISKRTHTTHDSMTKGKQKQNANKQQQQQESAPPAFVFGDETTSPVLNGEEEKQLDLKLSELGLVRKQIPKDGACLFRAVSEQLYLTQLHHTKSMSQSGTRRQRGVACTKMLYLHVLYTTRTSHSNMHEHARVHARPQLARLTYYTNDCSHLLSYYSHVCTLK